MRLARQEVRSDIHQCEHRQAQHLQYALYWEGEIRDIEEEDREDKEAELDAVDSTVAMHERGVIFHLFC